MKRGFVFGFGFILLVSFVSAGFFSNLFGFTGSVVEEGSCFDSDGGRDYLERGVVESGDIVETDYCIDGANLIEYYCGDNGEILSEQHNGICEDGVSIVERSGGVLIEEDIGDFAFSDILYDDDCGYVFEDNCEIWVAEYYHSLDGSVSASGGVEIHEDSIDNNYFIESIRNNFENNAEIDFEEIGGTYVYLVDFSNNYLMAIWYHNNFVIANFMEGSDSVGPSDFEDLLEEYLDKYSSDLIPEAIETVCSDGDFGKAYYDKSGCADSSSGSMEDGCISGGDHDGWLREVYCDGECKFVDYNCPLGCEDGACVELDYNSCVDSDGGLNYYEAGNCAHRVDGPILSHGDVCGITVNGVSYPNIMVDWYCSDSGFCTRDEEFLSSGQEIRGYDCTLDNKVCNNGRCEAPGCKDSDGGKDYYKKGTASGVGHVDSDGKVVISDSSFKESDECYVDSDGEKSSTYIVEAYCDSEGIVRTKKYECPEGCKDGVCLGEKQDDEEEDDDSLDDEVVVEDFVEEDDSLIASCVGCEVLGNCYPIGYREDGEYCSKEKEMIAQVSGKSFCENNFECESNLCVDSECISEGFFRKIMNWFRRMFD